MAKTPYRRQRRTPGDFVRIPLQDGNHTYGRVLEEPLVAFYDAMTTVDLDLGSLASRPILFRLCVQNSAITRGRWPVIGSTPLTPDLVRPPVFFRQDAIDPALFFLHHLDGHETPASRQQCIGLERAAVWDPEHVEDRLHDHYLGRPNKWLQSLAPK